ncbi:MAG TPA: hypothetical protein PKN86_06195, partial [Candidatus Obscuribacter sp.]|nr:hypothetical protein [Candidatus Obscuribacter sp.]
MLASTRAMRHSAMVLTPNFEELRPVMELAAIWRGLVSRSTRILFAGIVLTALATENSAVQAA